LILSGFSKSEITTVSPKRAFKKVSTRSCHGDLGGENKKHDLKCVSGIIP